MDNLARPFTLSPRDMRHVYCNALCTLDLEATSPFWASVWAYQVLHETSLIHTPPMLAQVIFDLLSDLLVEGMEALRQNYHWAPVKRNATLAESVAELERVAHTGHTQLMSYAAIYHYSVRADLELRWQAIDRIYGVDGRVLRRYHNRTWRDLQHRFLARENAARRVMHI